MGRIQLVTWVAVVLSFPACAGLQRSPQKELMHAAAAECQSQHYLVVQRYEFDRFDRIIAYYTENTTPQVLDPFFACYRERLREKIRATGAAPAPAPTASRAAATVDPTDAPIWKPGYEWAYQWQGPSGRGTFVWAVSREQIMEGIDCYVITSGSREIFFRKSDLASVMQTNVGAMETRSVPPRLNYVWPLAPGKSWEQLFTWERARDRGATDALRVWRVEGVETVTVPAGQFRTLKIVSRSKWANAIVLEYWYAPDVRQIVRMRDHLANGVETRELTRFKLD